MSVKRLTAVVFSLSSIAVVFAARGENPTCPAPEVQSWPDVISLGALGPQESDETIEGPLFTPADLDVNPRIIYQPSPYYDDQMRAKAPGWVIMTFVVNQNGRVVRAKVQNSSDMAFEDAALEAVKGWKFEPGKRDGRPVSVRMRVPITFPVPDTGESTVVQADTEADAEGHRMTRTELKIWNDPKFQQQFIESYVAETEIEPRVTADERDQMEKILELISSDKMDRARAMLEKYRSDASSAVFDFTLANIYFQQEDLEPAAAAYQVAVDKYPKFRRAWRNLGIIYMRQSEYEKALPALAKVIELGGGDAITYGLLGFAYAYVENHLASESALRMATVLDPNTMDWKMGLARALLRQERYADASALFKRLIREEPERTELWLLQANAFLGLNEPLKAAENYELVDMLGGSTPDSLFMLGDIYINEGLYELAIQPYARAMELDPESKPSRVIRATKVLVARNALEDAKTLIGHVENFLKDQIGDAERKDLLKLQAVIAVAEGHGDDQIKVLEEIAELDPLDGDTLIKLGEHAAGKGNKERAMSYYDRAVAIENEEVQAVANVRIAQLLVKDEQYGEAVKHLRKAQELRYRDNIQDYLERVERLSRGV